MAGDKCRYFSIAVLGNELVVAKFAMLGLAQRDARLPA
ncbi:MAG: hypothetical protein JWN42_573 [Candidatus Angelobacter sp.]|nr:hypothetical protein [Candidatus Angelobacter sp.]